MDEQPQVQHRRYLMCPPDFFEVSYRINLWMRPGEPVDPRQARGQWTVLRDELTRLGHQVVTMPAKPGLPDLVFTANGGIAIGARALAPRFRHPERELEAELFAAALREWGVPEVRTATQLNEGEGDFRLVGATILAGYGFRSDRTAVAEVEQFFELPVVPLRLVDPRFYHLDTALAVLDERTVACWPGAFDRSGQDRLAQLFPDAILADEADAAELGLNLISDGRTVVMAPGCPRLSAQLSERGFDVVARPSAELRKAGGGVKCCVLEWHSDPRGSTNAAENSGVITGGHPGAGHDQGSSRRPGLTLVPTDGGTT